MRTGRLAANLGSTEPDVLAMRGHRSGGAKEPLPLATLESRSSACVVPRRFGNFGDIPTMRKIEDYRHHAEECRTLARRSKTQGDRDMLLNMAATWDKLAEGRAKTIETQQRLATLPDQ